MRQSAQDREQYPVRILGCLVASLLVVLATIHLWPASQASGPRLGPVEASEQDLIVLEDIQPTRQTRAQKPPPPAPLPPVVVPNDQIIEEDLDLTGSFPYPVFETGDDAAERRGGETGTNAAVATSYEAPRARLLSEPEYPREARRRGIRAEALVQFEVGERGEVVEARIVERFLLDGELKRPVDEMGYGLEEAILAAAQRYRFRPARRNGKPVPGQASIWFTLGVR